MKKIHALIPSEREKECGHEMARYSGSVPCTGPIVCQMCSSRLPDDFFDAMTWQRIGKLAASLMVP